MKYLFLMAGCAVLSLVAGCASSQEAIGTATEGYKAWVGQQRTHDLIRVEGHNMEIRISGVMSLVMTAPLSPLQMLSSPDTQGRFIDAVKNTVLGAVGIWGVTQFARPTIVEQAPPVLVPTQVIGP